jgi:outer membrane lipoprotein-sorting protein
MRTALASAAAFLVLAFPVRAEMLTLSTLSEYLNGIGSAQSRFVQISDDGVRSEGTLYIQRPGRARFEYDPPNGAVVVAGGGAVVIYDPKSNQGPESYPLNRTPLSVILADHIDLGRDSMVVDHRGDEVSTVLTAQDPDNPDAGRIDLVFAPDPVRLAQWVITDSYGGQTIVVLEGLAETDKLSDLLFNPQIVGESPGR